MKKHVFCYLLVLFFAPGIYAQGIPFLQPSGVPMYFNPGLAGATSDTRFTAVFMREAYNIPFTPANLYLSYDQLSNKLRGGIGLEYRYTTAAEGLWRSSSVGATYSAKLSLGQRWTLSTGLKATFQSGHNLWRHIASDRINSEFAPQPEGLFATPGLVINSPNFYVGLAVDAILLKSFYTSRYQNGPQSEKAPPRVNLQTGYEFQPSNGAPWSLSLSGLGSLQQEFSSLQLQSMFRYKRLLFGMGAATSHRPDSYLYNTKTLFGSIGYKSRRIRIVGSFAHFVMRDYPGLGTNSMEISATFYLPRKLATQSLTAI